MGHIRVGNRVEIESQFGGSESNRYSTTVLEILGEDEFFLDEIRKNREVINLSKEKDYIFIVYTGHGIYKYDGKIDEYKAGTIGGKIVNCPTVSFFDEGTKLERREYFRFNCNIHMTFSIADQYTVSENRGNVIDLSAGGFKFLSTTELNKNDIISLEFFLEDEILFLTAEVMYIDRSEETSEYQYRCRFINLLDSDRDVIIQTVLDAQRNTLKVKRFRENGGER